MLKDITLGQYYPTESVIHRLDPRVKLMGTLVYIIALFIAGNAITFAYMAAVLVTMIILCKVPVSFMVKGLRSIIVLIIIAGAINVLFTPGEPLVSFGIINITLVGIKKAAIVIIRMIFLIVGTSILTLTTSPTKLTEGLEKAFGFLAVFNAPVHEVAMMMSIALRFIPILMEEADKIMKAQLARGADFTTGSLIKRAKAIIPILVPLFVSAFRRANDLAMAMEARCYNGGKNRTKMYPLVYAKRDKIAYIILAAVLAGVIALRVIF